MKVSVDREALENRLNEIRKRRSFLEDYVGMPKDEFISDRSKGELALRDLQVAIQACLDIAKHIVATANFRTPENVKEMFLILAENKIISKDLAKNLQNATGLRNILVHSYLDVDLEKVHEHLQKRLSDFDKFTKNIEGFLRKTTRL